MAQVPSTPRREYLDWLRGVAVLIMIEAHVVDAWTRPADRSLTAFGHALVLGGMGAPLFLLLAGVAAALAATARARRLADPEAAATSVRRRGLQIFGYAFLFRLQAFVLSPGAPIVSLLKVDILNIMGPGIVMAATLWQWGRTTIGRGVLLALTTIAIAVATPGVRAAPALDALPDPVEWYLRPVPGHTNFTMLPWSGFVTAGALCGLVLATRDAGADRRANAWLAGAGALVAAAAYGASWLPPLFPGASFWTSSPTFFFLRTGLLVLAIGGAFAWRHRSPRRALDPGPLVTLGRSSLFVYWIHVELVYGPISWPLHRTLPLAWTVVAFGLFSAAMLGLVVLKNRLSAPAAAR